MNVSSEITGLKELESQLAKLTGATQGKTLRSALRKSALPVKADMESNVSSNFNADTGQLSESIAIRTTLNKKGAHSIYDAAAFVGVYKNKKAQSLAGSALDAPVYAYWLETGVKPHVLNPKGLNNLMHPGITASPFVRPALINNATKIIATTKTELAKGIKRAIKRQNK